MKNFFIQPLASLILLAFTATMAPADEVVLTTGERRQGRVEAITGEPGMILLISGSQQIRLPRERIDSIVEQDDAEDFTILGNQFLRTQNYDRALQMFQRALEANGEHPGAQSGMEKVRQMMNEEQAEAVRQQMAENSEKLTKARELIENGDYSTSEELLNDILATQPPEDLQAAAQLARRDLYLAWASSREDRLDPVGAEKYLQMVLEIDEDNPKARDLLLRVWETDPAKREQVVEVYKAKLEENPDDLVINQKLADTLLTMNNYEDAVDPLKRLFDSGRYRALNYDQRLEEAMKRTAESKAQRGELDEAITIYEELLQKFPNADPTPLTYLRYERRLQDIPADDWNSRAALLKDLTSKGLETVALQEADYIVRNDPENEIANALLRKDAETRLAEAQEAMNRGQFVMAKSLARNFAQSNVRYPDLVQVAADLYAKADIEAQRQAKRLREEAREIVGQADTYAAEARRYAELHKSAENQNRSRIFTYKTEALKYARRAIEAYEIALQIDPSVGALIGGMDVDSKLEDVKSLQAQLTRPPIRTRLPQGESYERRRSSGGTSSPGSVTP